MYICGFLLEKKTNNVLEINNLCSDIYIYIAARYLTIYSTGVSYFRHLRWTHSSIYSAIIIFSPGNCNFLSAS